ncbi:MAG: hypothetical protein Kow0037_06480 [Calditrichia bacterium]
MHRFMVFLVLCLILLSGQTLLAQGELEVFGFFQGQLANVNGEYEVKADVPTPNGTQTMVLDKLDDEYINSNIQQMNLFFRKEISGKFTAMVNLEFTNSFSTERSWGNLNLEEAWLRYQASDKLSIKAGLLIPTFNNMNEIKNKSPLLPYILRPLVYEASYSALLPIPEYIPERAFVQAYGELPAGKASVDYAVYVGQSETSYIRNEGVEGPKVPGTDTTKFKLVGGRLGVKYGNLKAGVSATYDKANRQATLGEDVPRTRLGADLNYSLANAFLEAEYISVKLDPKADAGDMDKLFYYATLGYNLSEKIYAYGSYSYLEDKETEFLSTGMKGYFVGVGYKPDFGLALKAQYGKFKADGNVTVPGLPVPADVHLDYGQFAVAVSVLF